MFADDAERRKKTRIVRRQLYSYISKIYEWSKTWEMELNKTKMPCTGNEKSAMRPSGYISQGKLLYQQQNKKKIQEW